MDFTPIIPHILDNLERLFPIAFFIAMLRQLGHKRHFKFSSKQLNRKLGQRINYGLHFFRLDSPASTEQIYRFIGARAWQSALYYIANKSGL
jgi:hypothetical protein